MTAGEYRSSLTPFMVLWPTRGSCVRSFAIVPWFHRPPMSVGAWSRMRPLAMVPILVPPMYSVAIRRSVSAWAFKLNPPAWPLAPWKSTHRGCQPPRFIALPLAHSARRSENALLMRLDMPEEYSFAFAISRSEEHTSELQSLRHLVCRLLLEKKKN